MSALRISDPVRRTVRLIELPPYHIWCLDPWRMASIGGARIGEERSGDDQGHERMGSYADRPEPKKRVTEARRRNNREAARRYRARQRGEA